MTIENEIDQTFEGYIDKVFNKMYEPKVEAKIKAACITSISTTIPLLMEWSAFNGMFDGILETTPALSKYSLAIKLKTYCATALLGICAGNLYYDSIKPKELKHKLRVIKRESNEPVLGEPVFED